MEEISKQIVGKISSYNIFNNLYPGIIFCYLLKLMFNTDILSNNWFENLIIFYFVGMVLSRVGSLVIETIMKTIKLKQKPLIKYAPYSDYEKASANETFIKTMLEVNNTYRTLLACFVCAFVYKICISINEVLVYFKCTFLQDNVEWLILIALIILFASSYMKQTTLIRKRVESVLERT